MKRKEKVGFLVVVELSNEKGNFTYCTFPDHTIDHVRILRSIFVLLENEQHDSNNRSSNEQ